MVVCVLLSRFALVAAVADRRELLAKPVALASEQGGRQVIGEVSAAAEAFGVNAGMRLGEALARCPELRLVPPDPEGVRSLWNETLDRLERIGAECESDRPGEAFFAADGLRGIHGGRLEDVVRAAQEAVGRPARIGCGPVRFSAYAAALRARPRRRDATAGVVTVPPGAARSFLAPLPVGLLRLRAGLDELPPILERLGIVTLGELAALPSTAIAERFGHPGLAALDLALGRDSALEPRRPSEPISERLELPESVSGEQLERALELLVGRLLSRPERRGRTLRSLAISARFVEGGTWRRQVTLRQASADPASLRTALAPRLTELPAPAQSIALDVEAWGPPSTAQTKLVEDRSPRAVRRARIAEAVSQVRQAAGYDAALRILEIDPDSRLPERRAALAPYPDGG